MKKKILIIWLIAILGVTLFSLTGCGNNKDNSNQKNDEGNSVATEDVNVIDNNDNYYVKIKGQKFNAGDKISDVSKVGLEQDSRVLSEKVAKNTYMIGAGRIYDSNKKIVCNLTPYNSTDSEITVADAVIGGVEVGDYQYDKISDEVLALDIEIVGGIKLGSSYDDVKKVFGETDKVYEAEKLGYKTYTYKSKEIYRSYEFTIDKDGKVSKIRWQNLVFNK